MIHLIKLELKRFYIKRHLLAVLIANIIILSLGFFIMTFLLADPISFPELSNVKLQAIDLLRILTRSTFMIWESVLISIIIIEEFRNKTISLLFTYPLNRKKLILAKIFFVILLTLIFIVVSEIFQNLGVYGLSKIFSFIRYEFNIRGMVNVILISISAILIGMIPLYIGMIRKSTIETIVSSLIIVSIVSQGNNGGLISILPVSVALGMIGLYFTFITIKKIVCNVLEV